MYRTKRQPERNCARHKENYELAAHHGYLHQGDLFRPLALLRKYLPPHRRQFRQCHRGQFCSCVSERHP